MGSNNNNYQYFMEKMKENKEKGEEILSKAKTTEDERKEGLKCLRKAKSYLNSARPYVPEYNTQIFAKDEELLENEIKRYERKIGEEAIPPKVPLEEAKIPSFKEGAEKPTAHIEEELERPTIDISAFKKRKYKDLKFDDIAGLDYLKRRTKRVKKVIKKPSVAKIFGVEPNIRIALYGPPGCGKTMVAEACANELNAENGLNAELLSAEGHELISKWLGDYQKNIAALLDYANEHASKDNLVVVLIDEVDTVMGGRDEIGIHDAFKRGVGTWLTKLDDKVLSPYVSVITTTNHPQGSDSALIRPGRIGWSILVKPPTKEERKKIFMKSIRDAPGRENIDFDKLAELTEGYSGADIAASEGICATVRGMAFDEDTPISMKDFERVISRKKPSILRWVYDMQKRLMDEEFQKLYPELKDFVEEYEKNVVKKIPSSVKERIKQEIALETKEVPPPKKEIVSPPPKPLPELFQLTVEKDGKEETWLYLNDKIALKMKNASAEDMRNVSVRLPFEKEISCETLKPDEERSEEVIIDKEYLDNTVKISFTSNGQEHRVIRAFPLLTLAPKPELIEKEIKKNFKDVEDLAEDIVKHYSTIELTGGNEQTGILLGRLLEKDAWLEPYYLNLRYPKVIYVCGKKGSGKSYTMSVITEGLALENHPNITKKGKTISAIIIDPQGVFTLAKDPNLGDKEEEKKQIYENLSRWGITPNGLKNIKIYHPLSSQKDFSLSYKEFVPEEWSAMCGGLTTIQDMSLKKTITGLYKKVETGVIQSFNIDDVMSSIRKDTDIQETTKTSLMNRLQYLDNTGILHKDGLTVKELLAENKVVVLDMSEALSRDENISDTLVGMIMRKVSELEKHASIEEQKGKKGDVPPAYIVIDEAHRFVPEGGESYASQQIIKYVRESRFAGCGVVLASQRPADIHSTIISQANVIISHMLSKEEDLSKLQHYAPIDFPKILVETRYGAKLREFPPGICMIADEKNKRAFMAIIRPKISKHGGKTRMMLRS